MTSNAWLPRNQRLRWLIIGGFLLLALLLRLETITKAPIEFEATRQYKSYLITRGFYFQLEDSIPQPQREIGMINFRSEERLEPPIMEAIMARVFWIVEREVMWLPRLVSAVFWLIGGVFIFLIAKDMTSPDGGLLAMLFFLFLPFAVPASRAFMPDPLMIMTLILSIYAILQDEQRQTPRSLMRSAAVTGIALVIKGVTVFPIMGMVGFMTLHKHGLRGAFLNRRVWVFVLLALLPSLLYYGYVLLSGNRLQGHLEKSLMPRLWFRQDFWYSWLDILLEIFTFPVLSAAVLGIFAFKNAAHRLMLLGLWFGYFVYGLITSNHISTHNYYSLPLIPIAALSLAALASLAAGHLGVLSTTPLWRAAVIGAFLFGLALNIYAIRTRLEPAKADRAVALAEEIGERVRHSPHTLLLSDYYGLPIKYHGYIAGHPWRTQASLLLSERSGFELPDAQGRFDELYQTGEYDYFIITALEEYANQPELQAILNQRFEVLAETPDYLIYDLRSEQ